MYFLFVSFRPFPEEKFRQVAALPFLETRPTLDALPLDSRDKIFLQK